MTTNECGRGDYVNSRKSWAGFDVEESAADCQSGIGRWRDETDSDRKLIGKAVVTNPLGHTSGSRPRADNVVYVCFACSKRPTRCLRVAERVRFLAPSCASEDGNQTSERIIARKKKELRLLGTKDFGSLWVLRAEQAEASPGRFQRRSGNALECA